MAGCTCSPADLLHGGRPTCPTHGSHKSNAGATRANIEAAAKRKQRTLELARLGLNGQQIADQLKKEGFKNSDRRVVAQDLDATAEGRKLKHRRGNPRSEEQPRGGGKRKGAWTKRKKDE
jgi:hypothetical protein